MDPAFIDFTMWRNADFSSRLSFVDTGTGEPADFSGSTFEMDIKTAAGAGSPAASATIGVADIAEGHVDLLLATNGLAVGTYVYDLVRMAGGARELLATGAFVVIEGVTQP